MAIKVRGGRALTLATVGALAASLFTIGGVATASSAANEVHACVHKKTRYARIVNPSTPCRKTEERVLIGGGSSPNGLAGTREQGPQGPAGPKGADGKPGVQGPAGPKGADGKPGVQGPKGDQGPKGETGPQGPAGKNGIDGKDGLNGKDGKDGKDGQPGKPGEDGKPGQPGAKGEDGKPGVQGPKGEDGKPGEPGAPGGLKSVTVVKQYFSGKEGSVSCASGWSATGGGFSGVNGTVTTSAPVVGSGNTPTGWQVELSGGSHGYDAQATQPTQGTDNKTTASTQTSGGGRGGTVYVICAK